MIAVVGSTGMLGRALKRAIGEDKSNPRHAIIAAGLVGGIQDNMARPVNFLRANLRIALDFLDKCKENGVTRLVYVGSSCMYPRDCPQPMKVEHLWTGPLEPTNEGYAIAKLAGEALCRAYRKQEGLDFRTAILCNLYGADDRGFREPGKAHVIPALIRRFQEARDKRTRRVELMGSGEAFREFMHADDAARGILHYLRAKVAPPTINIGSGKQVKVKDLALLIAGEVGYQGKVEFRGGEDGMPVKLLDSSAIRGLGWKPVIKLPEGLKRTIQEAPQ